MAARMNAAFFSVLLIALTGLTPSQSGMAEEFFSGNSVVKP
jgi:hypothetical protein